LFLAGVVGQDDGEPGGTVRDKPDAIKTVRDVDFDEVDGAGGGIRVADGGQKTVKRVTELHRIGGRLFDGVVVDAVKGEVDNEPGPAFTLRDDTEG
jgi:hypothetical protein